MANGNTKKSFLDYFRLSDSSDDDFDDDLFDEYEDDYADDTAGNIDDYEDDDYYNQRQTRSSITSAFGMHRRSSRSAAASDNRSYDSRPQRPAQYGNSNAKLVSINGKAGRVSDDGEVFVIRPDEFEDAQMIIDHLANRQIIVINMEDLDLPTAQRIADFIGGACYAVDGEFLAISGNIFLATPNGTYVSGDLRDELAEGSYQGKSFIGN